MLTIAGTGHRPDKLQIANPYGDHALSRLTALAKASIITIQRDKQADEVQIVSGMALACFAKVSVFGWYL